MDKSKILYVDGNQSNLNFLKVRLDSRFEVILSLSPEMGRDVLKNDNNFCVVISDQKLILESGEDFLFYVKKNYPEISTILLSDKCSLESLTDAINEACIYKYISRPVNVIKLNKYIQEAQTRFELRKEMLYLAQSLYDKNIKIGELLPLFKKTTSKN